MATRSSAVNLNPLRRRARAATPSAPPHRAATPLRRASWLALVGLVAGSALARWDVWTTWQAAASAAVSVALGAVVACGMAARPSRILERLEDRVVAQAFRDDGTGLPNRTSLELRLQDAVRDALGSGAPTALLLLELDRFAEYATKRGNEAADGAAAAIGQLIARTVRHSDFVAYLGQGRIAVVAERIERPQAVTRLAESLLRSVREGTSSSATTLPWTASVGIAVCPIDSTRPDALHDCAARALAIAQQTGGDEYWRHSAGEPRPASPSRL